MFISLRRDDDERWTIIVGDVKLLAADLSPGAAPGCRMNYYASK